MSIAVEPVPNSGELILKPSVSEMYNVVSRCFDRIISVSSDIPTIESILFPELEKTSTLFPVFRRESAVSKIIHKEIFEKLFHFFKLIEQIVS